MGHRKTHAPRHGSLAYLPRKRAEHLLARMNFWPPILPEVPRILGFMAYKAGMTHIYMVEDRKRSPDFGKEVARAATVLDTPPILICALRAYAQDIDGLHTLTEAWTEDVPKNLERVLTPPEKFKAEEGLKRIEQELSNVVKLRVVAVTQPKEAGRSKKKPDIAEIELGGGTVQQQFEFAKSLIGKTVTPAEIFREGQYVDVASVSTGKGFQGPVKRWGVTILQAKGRKTKRGIATLGPWNPHHVMYSIARAGQMGYHQRTEYNKRILKIGKDGKEVTPRGGFLRYGLVRGPYMILAGSVAGTEKRPVRLRFPARPPRNVPEEPPQVTQVSLESPQGR
jgi:large subunit ribosomal protein L3